MRIANGQLTSLAPSDDLLRAQSDKKTALIELHAYCGGPTWISRTLAVDLVGSL